MYKCMYIHECMRKTLHFREDVSVLYPNQAMYACVNACIYPHECMWIHVCSHEYMRKTLHVCENVSFLYPNQAMNAYMHTGLYTPT